MSKGITPANQTLRQQVDSFLRECLAHILYLVKLVVFATAGGIAVPWALKGGGVSEDWIDRAHEVEAPILATIIVVKSLAHLTGIKSLRDLWALVIGPKKASER